MKYEKSCGVIVFSDNKVLMVKQNSKEWSIPKGHVENNETEKETALREVKEESNIDAKIVGDFREIMTYSPKDKVLKNVIFFTGIPVNDNLKPQQGEILEAKYFDFDDALNTLKYEDSINLLKKGINYYKKNINLFK